MKSKINKNMVLNVLEDYPATRNSDLLLGNKICEVYHIYLAGIDWMKEANFVSRTRRRIQQEGKYMPTEYIGRRRKQLAESYKEEYVSGKNQIQSMVLNHLMARI